MKKRDYIYCSLLIALGSFGIYIGNFGGGFLTGITFTILTFITVGLVIAHLASKRLEQKRSPNAKHQTPNN